MLRVGGNIASIVFFIQFFLQHSTTELLLEPQDINRFHQSDQLAADVGLTPTQYSDADKLCMSRKASIRKKSLCAILVRVAFLLLFYEIIFLNEYVDNTYFD